MAKMIGTGDGIAIVARSQREGADHPVRTSFRLSKDVKQAMQVRITQDGYGLRGKSRWITTAVTEFLGHDTWVGLPSSSVGLAVTPWKRIVIDKEMAYKEKDTVPDAINVTKDLWIMLWRSAMGAALYGAELDDPVYLEISVAAIIRAAITWKLGEFSSNQSAPPWRA